MLDGAGDRHDEVACAIVLAVVRGDVVSLGFTRTTIMEMGQPLTGITWKDGDKLPTDNPEGALDFLRMEGIDEARGSRDAHQHGGSSP